MAPFPHNTLIRQVQQRAEEYGDDTAQHSRRCMADVEKLICQTVEHD